MRISPQEAGGSDKELAMVIERARREMGPMVPERPDISAFLKNLISSVF